MAPTNAVGINSGQPAKGIPYSKVETAKTQGLDFADTPTMERYNKDQDADPKRDHDFIENMARGFAGTAREHLAGIVGVIPHLMMEGKTPDQVRALAAQHPELLKKEGITPERFEEQMKTMQHLRDVSNKFHEGNNVQGAGGWVGAAGENIAEFLGMDGLLKLAPEAAEGAESLTQAQKMAAAAKTAKVLEEQPKIAKLAALGMKTLASAGRTGAVSAGQTYLDTGGDTDAAESAGLWGAGTAGVLEGGIGGVGLAREVSAAKAAEASEAAENYANAKAHFPQDVADRNQKFTEAKDAAVNAMKAQRQIEAQAGISNIAKDATQDGLQRFNEALGPDSAHAVDLSQVPDSSSFGDTVDAWKGAAKPVYDKINEATGGKFNELQQARSSAIRARDFVASDEAEKKITDLLNSKPKGVQPEEWKAAKSLWHDSKDMERIHTAVEGAFNGINPEMAAQPGVSPRLLRAGSNDGGTLQTRLGKLQFGAKKFSDDRITQLIGPDGLTGLYRASHMTSTPELRAATQKLVQEVAAQLPMPLKPVAPAAASAAHPIMAELGKSASAGALGGYLGPMVGLTHTQGAEGAVAARWIFHQMITNPTVGKMAEYAVDYGATPDRAAKVIAAMIGKQVRDGQAPQEQQQ